MSFIKLDNEREKVLHTIIIELEKDNDLFCNYKKLLSICNSISIWENLLQKNYLRGNFTDTLYDDGFFRNIIISQSGLKYFELKKIQNRIRQREWIMFFIGIMAGQVGWIVTLFLE